MLPAFGPVGPRHVLRDAAPYVVRGAEEAGAGCLKTVLLVSVNGRNFFFFFAYDVGVGAELVVLAELELALAVHLEGLAGKHFDEGRRYEIVVWGVEEA